MKVVFFSTSAFFPLHFGLMMDEAEIMYRQGHEVYFVYCNNATSFCSQNLTGKQGNCNLCRWSTRHAIHNLSKGIKILNIKDFYENTDNLVQFEFKSIDDIKSIEYKNVKIGYGVLSTYISLTRNNEPIFDKTFYSYINNLLNVSRRLTDACEKIIDFLIPDKVNVFNGRLFEFRPVLDYCISKKIPVRSYDVIGGYGEEYYKLSFENCLPHNIKNYNNKVVDLWNSPEVSMEEKKRIGSSFYQNRRNGKPACDKIYIKSQQSGLLPSGWDDSKRNFVIFNSSEDEHVAVGDEYSSLDFFPSQIEGIRTMLKMTEDKKDIHFYLRIHPNLSLIKYSYHKDLYKLAEAFSNITVIPGSDKISTYELMEKSEKVIVFGSTMGLESSFWKKPVINLAGCGYSQSGICFMPKDLPELKDLLISKLTPKDNLFAVQFGYFKMHRNEEDKYKFIDFNFKVVKYNNLDFKIVNYQKILGSRRLFAILEKFVGRYYSIKDKSNPLVVPLEGR